MMNDLHKFETSIETPQLILRTLRPENMSSAYLDWLQDDEIIQYLEIRHLDHNLENITAFVQNNFISPDDLLMGIFLKSENQHIGNIKLGPINWRYRRGYIGLMIGERTQWGKGLATEAITGIVSIAKKQLGLMRVQAGAYANNVGSIRAFEKAGFTQEGLLKSHWIFKGKAEDEVLFGKVIG